MPNLPEKIKVNKSYNCPLIELDICDTNFASIRLRVEDSINELKMTDNLYDSYACQLYIEQFEQAIEDLKAYQELFKQREE